MRNHKRNRRRFEKVLRLTVSTADEDRLVDGLFVDFADLGDFLLDDGSSGGRRNQSDTENH
jgi:hypothetical protein